MNPHPIIAIGPTNIGDALLCLPALRRVMASHPGHPTVLLLGPAAHNALHELLPDLTVELLQRPRGVAGWWAVTRQLKTRRPVRLIDFRKSAVALLVAPWQPRTWRVMLRQVLPPRPTHAGDAYATATGLPPAPRATLSPADFGLAAPQTAHDDIAVRLAPVADRPLAVLQLGANHGPKRYPLLHWLTVAQALEEQGHAIAWAGMAAPEDRPNPVPPGHVDLINATTFPELAALLRRASLVISNDSGPMHLAAALGVPVVGLFGQTSAARYGPYAPWGVALQSEVPCSPCNMPACRYGTPFCLDAVAPEQVVNTALELARRPGG